MGFDFNQITEFSYVFELTGLRKHCRPRSDAAERDLYCFTLTQQFYTCLQVAK